MDINAAIVRSEAEPEEAAPEIKTEPQEDNNVFQTPPKVRLTRERTEAGPPPAPMKSKTYRDCFK